MEEREILTQLGQRLQELRIKKGITLADLSKKAGVSAGSLSQLERGRGNPAFMTLVSIAQALEVETGELFSNGDPSAATVITKRDRIKIKNPGRGVFAEKVTPDGLFAFEALLAKYEPNSKEDEPYNHRGGETLFVIQGNFEFHYGNRTYQLQEGETISFRGEVPHSAKNPGDTPAVVLMIIEK